MYHFHLQLKMSPVGGGTHVYVSDTTYVIQRNNVKKIKKFQKINK